MQEFGSKMRSLENLTILSLIKNLDLNWITSLKSLKTLKIRSWSYFQDIWIEDLKKMDGLKKLTMYDCRFEWDVFNVWFWTERRMSKLVLNVKYLLLLSFLTVAEFYNLGYIQGITRVH